MAPEDADKLRPGQLVWFQLVGDVHEVAGPSIVLEMPVTYWNEFRDNFWTEVIVLTPRTRLDARDEELHFREPT